MLRFTALALAFAAAAAANSNNNQHSSTNNHHKVQRRYAKKVVNTTEGLSLATLGVYDDKKCHGFPNLVVETPPGACTPFPGTYNYFQLLCGEEASGYEDDSSKESSGGRRLSSEDSSSSSSSTGDNEDSSDSSSSSSSSYSTSKDGKYKNKPTRTKPTHESVVLRLCRDKWCKKCKRVVVTQTNKCTGLPTKYWSTHHQQSNIQHHNNQHQSSNHHQSSDWQKNNQHQSNDWQNSNNNNQHHSNGGHHNQPHHNSGHQNQTEPIQNVTELAGRRMLTGDWSKPSWGKFIAKCPGAKKMEEPKKEEPKQAGDKRLRA